MKKKLLILLSFVVFGISTHSSAQSENGFFLSLNTGYNFSSAGVTGFTEKTQQINQNVTTIENLKLSFGKGINFGIAAGYMFNRNIGTEIEVNYLLGGKTSYSNSSLQMSGGSVSNNDLYARMLQFKPSIIIAAGKESINPYAKFGPVIGSGSIYYESNETSKFITIDGLGNPVNVSNQTTTKATYNGGIALGLHAAVGVSIGLNTSLSLFGELNMVNLSYSPTKGKITESTLNGVDNLPSLPVSVVETEFVDVETRDNVTPTNQNLPTKIAKITVPFGSFGINFGLRYAL
jgi:opacity protein-like surface antigen